MSDEWWMSGEEAEEYHDEEDERRRQSSDRIFRFWMPPPRMKDGKKTESINHLTFVDPPVHPEGGFKLPFVYMEHNLHLDGSWKNWFTCPKREAKGDSPAVPCPLCQAGDKPYLAAAYTIIDHSEWKGRDGTVHKDEVKLYIVKSKVLKVLRRASAKKNGLRGWRVEVCRTDDKAPNTGDQFDFEDKTELPEDIQPYDYRVVLAPKSQEELAEIIGDLDVEGEEAVRF